MSAPEATSGIIRVSRFTRRLFIGSTAAIAAGAATSVPFPGRATLMVGGAVGGAADDWAGWLAPGLLRALPPGTAVRKEMVGGADGVTAANQFDALTEPDGGTALLMPGSAAMAWLVGDPRARFDAAQWVSALAGITPGLVVSRVAIARGARIRLAASTPAGPELPAMLALDMLGGTWSPVFGLSDTAAFDALAKGQVDAICLRGRRVAEAVQQLGTTGARPVFTFGSVDTAGGRQRDPAFAETPALSELLVRQDFSEALRRAWFATAAASDLDVTLVLPHLTPAAIVALWRHAAAQAVAAASVQAHAAAQGVRPQLAPAAAASTAAMLADASGQLALRGWMAQRLDYRPG